MASSKTAACRASSCMAAIKSPRHLPAAGTGAQPGLGPYPAAPHCRSRGTGNPGNRIIATAGKSDGLREATFMRLSSSPSPNTRAGHIVKLSYPENDTSPPKLGFDYTLLRGGDG